LTQANRYAYAANDPIYNSDPTGKISQGCVLSIAGVVIGVAAVDLALFGGGAASIASGGTLTPVAAGGLALAYAGTVVALGSAAESCG